ncbi:ATP-dependent RNA helicase DHX30 [Anthophora quadrimaculata]
MLSQITNNSKRTLHRHLICYTKQVCVPHFKKDAISHKCQAVFYGTINREPKTNLKYKTFNHEHEGSIGTESTSNSIFLQYEFLKKLYPRLTVDLANIYNIVNNELSKNCLSITYTINMKSINERVKCNIDITWPENLSFSCTGSNKKIASEKAALMCLSWLYKHKKINGMKPSLYNHTNIQQLLKSQEYIRIDLAPQLKMEIQSLIDTFNNIELQTISKVSEDDLETDGQDTSSLNSCISSDLISKRNNELKKYKESRKNNVTDLPILQYKDEILSKLQNNQVLVIKGDTGSGKSTQVPQFIIDAYIKENRGNECNIVVSVPRRIAAVSLANHVTMERNEKLESDPTLKGVSHVIIDEAHERNLQTDLILKFFKDFLKNNSHVKLIIMSATVNTEMFEKYFSCETFNVPGILYPVKMHFLDDIDIFKEEFSSKSNLVKMDIPFAKIVDLIKWIIKTKPPGGILCFLPGWQEIKQLHKLLENTKMNNLLILPLHSKLANMNLQKIFAPVSDDVTKIILATDIAESSITIKDIRYVIDTAIKKEVSWNEKISLSSMNITFISQANILQRKGRAGRVKAGESFHLITRKEYNNLQKFPSPDILKIPLEEAVIASKVISKEEAKDFFNAMIESPSNISINSAIENLKKLGILDKDENFTNLGNRVKHLGLHPKLSKALILSCIFQCLDPMLSIICTFSNDKKSTLSINEGSHNAIFKSLKLKYHDTSDHIAIIKNLNDLTETKDDSLFSIVKNSYLNSDTLQKLRMIYVNEIINSGVIPLSPDLGYVNMYSDNNELIRAILFASTNQLIKRNPFGYKKGLFTKNANVLLTESRKHVQIKNESVNYGRKTWPSDILTYIFIMKFINRNSNVVIDTSLISPLTALLFSSGDVVCSKRPIDKSTKEKKVFIKINGIKNLSFYCEEEIANVLLTFRNILWRVVDILIEHEGTFNCQNHLRDVHKFKINLMSVLTKVLRESSKNIDNTHTD